MLDLALNFEQISARFDPAVLIGAGVICVMVGLFIWLGGLGLRRPLAAVTGAVGGGVCGFFMSGRNVTLTAVAAAVTAVIAAIFERIFIRILAAALAAVFGLAILARPYVEDVESQQYQMKDAAESLNVPQTVEILKAYAADFAEKVKQIYQQLPANKWAIITVLVVIFLVAGVFLWRLTSALCCAALGSLLIFCGLILLLLYKGAAPINHISQRQLFYLGVFLAMIAFGTCVQLLFCYPIVRRPVAKKQKDRNEQEREEKSSDWRTT